MDAITTTNAVRSVSVLLFIRVRFLKFHFVKVTALDLKLEKMN